jgi:hypothetical protein
VFPSGIAFGGRASAYLSGNKAGPCPRCGGWGSIPDGLYEAFDNTLRIVSDWAPTERQQLADELAQAREHVDPVAARRALKRRPDLFALAERLLVPTNPAEFWALIAAILAALAYFR